MLRWRNKKTVCKYKGVDRSFYAGPAHFHSKQALSAASSIQSVPSNNQYQCSIITTCQVVPVKRYMTLCCTNLLMNEPFCCENF